MDPIDVTLEQLVKDWLDRSSYAGTFIFSAKPARVICRCCKIIWMTIHQDRIAYTLTTKGATNFKKFEVSAATPQFFEEMAYVFENVQHDK